MTYWETAMRSIKHPVALGLGLAAAASAGASAPVAGELPPSAGTYRLPYADGTRLSVFDDGDTHRPAGAVDLVGEPRTGRIHRIVAAADGKVMAIRDDHGERQSGRAAALCRNNFVWIAHANGEWTLYSHMRQGSSRKAGLKVGDRVKAGQYLGDEGDVGCAMLSHLHFEVALPNPDQPIDAQGFITDNEGRKRIRVPRFCGVAGAMVRKDRKYEARRCRP